MPRALRTFDVPCGVIPELSEAELAELRRRVAALGEIPLQGREPEIAIVETLQAVVAELLAERDAGEAV